MNQYSFINNNSHNYDYNSNTEYRGSDTSCNYNENVYNFEYIFGCMT